MPTSDTFTGRIKLIGFWTFVFPLSLFSQFIIIPLLGLSIFTFLGPFRLIQISIYWLFTGKVPSVPKWFRKIDKLFE